MASYFYRDKYQIDMLSKEQYEKWALTNPGVDYQKFKKYFRLIRDEIFTCILENPSGVDLPFYMGNLSVKVLDIDFKCADDLPRSTLTNKITGEKYFKPFYTSEIPKKIKITWKKHSLFKSLPSIFGIEACRTFKKVISAGVRNNLQKYEKAFLFDKTPSKCEDKPKPSLFDLA